MKNLLLILLFIPISLYAKEISNENIIINNKQFIKTSSDKILIAFDIIIGENVQISSNRMATISVSIHSKDLKSLQILPSVYVYGKNREIIHKRQHIIDKDAFSIVRRKNGINQKITYALYVPYETWMDESSLNSEIDICGCGNEKENIRYEILANMSKKNIEMPSIALIAPKYEDVKIRKTSIKISLLFHLNDTVIDYKLGNNIKQISKVINTLETLKNDSTLCIQNYKLTGYASPEGAYNNNKRLSIGRANSLKNVLLKYSYFNNKDIDIHSVAEDWEGVRKYVQENDFKNKKIILQILNDSILSADDKEIEIKHLDNYAYILNYCFNPLRRSVFDISYIVRNYTINESRNIFKKNPQNLSLNEMYNLANEYELGSDDFNEIFLTAVRMFPSDNIANINAAGISLLKNDLLNAKKHLDKSDESMPQTMNNLGAYFILNNNKGKALVYFKKAAKYGLFEAEENIRKYYSGK